MVLALERFTTLVANVAAFFAVNEFVLCQSTGVVESLAANCALNNGSKTTRRPGRR